MESSQEKSLNGIATSDTFLLVLPVVMVVCFVVWYVKVFSQRGAAHDSPTAPAVVPQIVVSALRSISFRKRSSFYPNSEIETAALGLSVSI